MGALSSCGSPEVHGNVSADWRDTNMEHRLSVAQAMTTVPACSEEIRRLSSIGAAIARSVEASGAVAAAAALARSEEVTRFSSIGAAIARSVEASGAVAAAAALARSEEVRRLSSIGAAIARSVEASEAVVAATALARSEEVKRLSSIGAAIARSVEAPRRSSPRLPLRVRRKSSAFPASALPSPVRWRHPRFLLPPLALFAWAMPVGALSLRR